MKNFSKRLMAFCRLAVAFVLLILATPSGAVSAGAPQNPSVRDASSTSAAVRHWSTPGVSFNSTSPADAY
jgi:hypothetical protein